MNDGKHVECREGRDNSIWKQISAEVDMIISVVATGAHEKPALSLEGDSFGWVVWENM